MIKIHRYFVVTKQDKNGSDELEIITGREGIEQGFYDGYYKNDPDFDLYIDGFNTKQEAKTFIYATTGEQEVY